jgi:hypothetical protein
MKALRSFLGTAGYYKKFIPNYSTLASPLFHLLKKQVKFKWTGESQAAFESSKQTLVSTDFLSYPDPAKPNIL